MFPLTISTVQDESDVSKVLEFMSKQSQYYPNYLDWVNGKCKSRIESGIYKTIFAVSSGKVIGDAVFRTFDDEVEIKNFRIDPDYQNRDLGHFLLKQVQLETNRPTIRLDVSANNFSGVEFFIRNGFKITGLKPLYSPNQFEYLMESRR